MFSINQLKHLNCNDYSFFFVFCQSEFFTMANESEFETVISEADVELGSVQPQMTSQEQDAPSNQVRIAPTGRWGIFSLNFLQQVCITAKP